MRIALLYTLFWMFVISDGAAQGLGRLDSDQQTLRPPVIGVPDIVVPSGPLNVTAKTKHRDALQEDQPACLSVDNIQAAEIQDDKTIILHLRNGLWYEMRLTDRCPGLGFYQGFYYRTSPNRQLCSRQDSVIARSGSQCLINSFVKIDRPGQSKKIK